MVRHAGNAGVRPACAEAYLTPYVSADLHLIAKVQGRGMNWWGLLRCATQREEVGDAMTLDQLRLSVDEMRARINDKIGDVLDDDLDCTSSQGRGELIDALKSLSIQVRRLLDLLKEED